MSTAQSELFDELPPLESLEEIFQNTNNSEKKKNKETASSRETAANREIKSNKEITSLVLFEPKVQKTSEMEQWKNLISFAIRKRACKIIGKIFDTYLFTYPFPLKAALVAISFIPEARAYKFPEIIELFHIYAFNVLNLHMQMNLLDHVFNAALLNDFDAFKTAFFKRKNIPNEPHWQLWTGPLKLTLPQAAVLGGNIPLVKFLNDNRLFLWHLNFESHYPEQLKNLGLELSCNLFNLAVLSDNPLMLECLWHIERQHFKENKRLIMLWQNAMELAALLDQEECYTRMMTLEPELSFISLNPDEIEKSLLPKGNAKPQSAFTPSSAPSFTPTFTPSFTAAFSGTTSFSSDSASSIASAEKKRQSEAYENEAYKNTELAALALLSLKKQTKTAKIENKY